MHPVVLTLRAGAVERPIGSYALFVALGIVVAGALAIRAAHRDRRDVGAACATLALAVLLGFATAYLTFALVEAVRTGDPLAGFARGGLVALGAAPGVAVALTWGRRALGLDTLRALELALPGVAAGHALGRLGCFLGGCCYGAPFDGPWAVTYLDPHAPGAHPPVPRHPAPLYESAGLLALAIALALTPPARPGSGRRLALYALAYGALRAAVEVTRGDAIRGVWLHGVSTSQLLAVGLGLVALVALTALRRATPPA